MPKINVLSKQTAELIAAGEVVERPASAIKEMVENAIDAGATRIKVEIDSGGIVLMRVTDNGCGIEPEDVKNAFLRHATSKIATEDDLYKIGTLGFRGEALAAISTVARVSLLTSVGDGKMGTHYIIDGGEEKLFEEVGCAKGTVIEVRDLFYNTPARMKFLKKDVKEGANVATIMDRMALSHPEIAFEFFRDGKRVLTTQGNGDLKDAVYSVFGRDIALGTLPIDYTFDGVRVSGLICKPFKCRPNRNMQIVFLNGRFVKSATVMAALDVGYKNSAMVGKFPYCVINISLPFSAVDVNVHPAKTEVRFSNENVVFDAVRFGVQSALKADDSRPQIDLNKVKTQIRMTSAEFLNEIEKDTKPQTLNIPQKSVQETFKVSSPPKTQVAEGYSVQAILASASKEKEVLHDTDFANGKVVLPKIDVEVSEEEQYYKSLYEKKNVTASPVLDSSVATEKEVEEISPNIQCKEQPTPTPDTLPRFIGEAFKTYIIAQWQGKLFIIDKHAAHERILYEKLKETEHHESQMLLSPATVTLQKEEHVVIISNIERINSAGFDIDDFGDNTVVVRAVPAVLRTTDYSAVLSELAQNLSSANSVFLDETDRIYHTVACKAATKSGYTDSDTELKQLMTEALTNDKIRYCPHGRPVAIELSEKELEKMFGRIQ